MPETPTKPPSTNPTLATEDPEAGGFLQRWSQRKVDAAAPTEPQSPTQTAALDAEDAALPHATDGEATDGPQSGEQAADAPPPVTEADLENLTYQSDYTKFMGEHVPEAIRRRALHQLWRSDRVGPGGVLHIDRVSDCRKLPVGSRFSVVAPGNIINFLIRLTVGIHPALDDLDSIQVAAEGVFHRGDQEIGRLAGRCLA